MVVPNSNYGHSIEDYLTSPFFVRKAKSYFKAMDVVSDDYLTMEDYEKLAGRAIENQQTQEKDEDIRKAWRSLFTDVVAAHVPHDPEAKVTFDQFLYNIATAGANTEVSEKIYRDVANQLFQIVDSNGDGYISVHEFRKYHEIYFGKHFGNESDTCFKSIDANQDGVISRQEFVNAILDYSYEAFGNEQSSVLPFGPLINETD